MGNNKSSSNNNSKSRNHHHDSSALRTPELTKSFNKLCNGGNVLSFQKFKEKFGNFLAPPLWRYLQEDSEATEMNIDQFAVHAQSLAGMSTDIYVKIFVSPTALLNAAFEAAEIELTECDHNFLESLKNDMKKYGDTTEGLIKWKTMVCPRICHAIQNRVLDKFFHRKRDVEIVKSDILTPAEMFILVSSLPVTIYFPKETSEESLNKSKAWTKLYSTHHQGISINRFDANVFQYRGPTVSIFQMTDNSIFVVACDQEWRHSVNKFGGSSTFLWQIRPTFQLYDLPEKPIYCNFKLRSGAFGINVGRHFTVDGEMANVAEMEVWGCAGDEVLDDQKKIKHRAKLQAERHGKVPLPGAWEENPDKNIMEMAGYEFSSEQRDSHQHSENY